MTLPTLTRHAGHKDVPPGDRLPQFLSRLAGVKQHGEKWQALCPAHDDRTPSLSISTHGDRVLVKCFAGCEPEAIMQAVGMTLRDLFLTPANMSRVAATRDIVATYDYTNSDGTLLYQVVRFHPKDFRQRRPDGAGGWKWNLQGRQPVLYRLARVLEAAARGDMVFVVEGEKDVHSLEDIGCVATCNAMGAGKWRPDYADALRGAAVVILPDNDEPGQKHGEDVAQSVRGKAWGVKVLPLPCLPEKGDVSDWLAAGHTRDELLTLVNNTLPWTPPARTPQQRFAVTDLGNAERLIAAHGRDLRFHVNAGSWLHWTGTLWATDDTGDIHRLATCVVRRMAEDAEALPAGDEREALFKHMLRSESAPRLAALVELAKFRPGVPVRAGDLDRDPWALNCLNGTLDLHGGERRPHDPVDLLTKLAPVAYDPTATCPRWEQFLREVFQENSDLITFTQRLAGYLLTGDTREQAVFFLVGKGANGKSVLLETLRALLGDYGRDTSFSTFLEQRDTSTADLAALTGARLVTASEAEGGQAFNEALLKRLTGGDPITCRYLYRDFFTYTPTFKILFATNEVPRLVSQGYAMRRRVHILPFRQTFYSAEEGKTPVRDKNLRDTLREELPGILAWAVRGCRDWQAHGLAAPRVVQEETTALFESFDPLADFLEELCIGHPSAQVEVGVLWKTYLTWCEEHERQPAFRAPHTFSRSLVQRDGIDTRRGNQGVRLLVGVGIRA